MRLRDIIDNGFKQLKEFTGPNRAKRRREEVAAKLELRTRPPKSKPHNWNRDQHKRRKAQKARRKQSQGGKAP